MIKTFLFCLGPLLCGLLIFVLCGRQSQQLPLDSGTRILMVGDSHPLTSLDDSLIEGAVNLAQSGEHLLYSHQVLKHLLGMMPNVEQVVLGLSYHSFTKSFDRAVMQSSKLNTMYPRYFQVLDKEAISDIADSPREYARLILRVMLKSILKEEDRFPFIGKFSPMTENELEEDVVQVAVQRHYYQPDGEELEFSKLQLKYLDKIISLCKQQEVELVIFSAPIHDSYSAQIPEKFRQHFDGLMAGKLSNLTHLDFHHFELPDSCYLDGDHINLHGAAVVSPIVDRKLRSRR